MALTLLSEKCPGLAPVTAPAGSLKIAGMKFGDMIVDAFGELAEKMDIQVRDDFLPSALLLDTMLSAGDKVEVRDPGDGAILVRMSAPGAKPGKAVSVPLDGESVRLRYPWDIIALNEKLVAAIDSNELLGTVRNGATLDGFVWLGRGSVILPGVYIEGNVVIGEDCKIGPNCYIRGNTSIGDRCHVGQAVEIKNSVLQDKVSVGHLSYAGDSVICSGVNFGAGTVISNLRHDGANHRFFTGGALVDTNRRKFGAIIGENVHTGIHTSIYPGRSLSAGSSTLPGEVVSHSK
ncbi:MAG: hypothetical protein PHI35_06965 [Victivallaceae bacterium]|nr:hypothetical protein [Victivallaceae bacterium]